MNKHVIELRGLSKVYETEELTSYVLQDINLTVDRGDYLSISGPSGCGKSTLLSILGLLDSASSGQYLIDGIEVTQLNPDQAAEVRNSKIGFVFQSFNLIEELTVFENAALPLRYSSTSINNEEIETRVRNCLDRVEMSHRIHHRPNQLSGGQQQRVSIARALVNNPEVLLVDEATGNLDSKSGDMVMDLLSELNKQKTTICMVTHDPRYAGIAKKQLRLLDGKLATPIANDNESSRLKKCSIN